MMTINERIKLIIRFKKITQKDLAKDIAMPECQLSRVVTGKRKPTVREVALISHHFGMTIDELVKGNELIDELLFAYEKGLFS